ncbi:DUF4142 domain-containing protein [Neorhizobium sp. BETTINA12A]|jgi:putative membrane protein|uniref:DUF4142 domain-containing protein n=1 Tax=Neorhizobium sp. BETTINA12A TaxID=2908924 RepID=UPI001FF30CC2|nr:DUF4142 domain-containing protein [Neorhizobium sp. BETTINA12A]MCJ9750756.1 DUF4142 domain-containing protein [Neorhizobium sp. BETTINA12A]
MPYKFMFAGLILAIGCTTAVAAMAKSDKEFLSDAIKTDNSEIRLGDLATKKGGSDGVRSFAQTLIDDHRRAKDDATALATDLDVKITGIVTTEAQNEIEKLQSLSGPEFDKEFVNYIVSTHEKDISEFREKAGEGGRPVPELAKKMLPTLQQHLQLAHSLSGH